jgi:hypothetical protein
LLDVIVVGFPVGIICIGVIDGMEEGFNVGG